MWTLVVITMLSPSIAEANIIGTFTGPNALIQCFEKREEMTVDGYFPLGKQGVCIQNSEQISL